LAATKVPGRQVVLVVKGDRLGKKVKIVLKGKKGEARGKKRVVKIGTKEKVTKRVKKLRPGTYRVLPKAMNVGEASSKAAKKKIKVTAKRGARVVVKYKATRPPAQSPTESDVSEDTTPSTPPNTSNTPAPTTPAPDVAAPGPVTALKVDGTTGDSVSLSWTNPADADLAGIVVRRSTTAAPTGPTDGDAVALAGPKAESVTDPGLAEDTEYFYAVFAKDAAGNVSAAESTSARTKDVTAPGPVTGVTPGTIDSRSVSFSWTNPTDADLVEVVVRRSLAADGYPLTATDGDEVPTSGSQPATTVTDSGPTPNKYYLYSIFTKDTSGNFSAAVQFDAATGFVVTGRTATTVSFKWFNPPAGANSNFDRVVIVRKQERGGAPKDPTDGDVVALSGPKATEATDTGLTPGTSYIYVKFVLDAYGGYDEDGRIAVRTLPSP
jgi:chitodextrinase